MRNLTLTLAAVGVLIVVGGCATPLPPEEDYDVTTQDILDDRIPASTDTLYVDRGFDPDAGCYYKVSAWDVHENESSPSLLGPDGIGGLDRTYPNALFQNVPNPFVGSTRIAFTLKEEGHVRLRVFDAKGRLVRTLVDGDRRPDRYVESWDGAGSDGRRLASGTYFYRLTADGFTKTGKMQLIK